MTPPMFGHGQLRLLLLALIAEEPRHGYELMQALSDRVSGSYVPSAGTVYPRLAKLEHEGLIDKHDDDRRTVYRITDAGRIHLDERADELAAITAESGTPVGPRAARARDGLTEAREALRASIDRDDRAERGRSGSSRTRTEESDASLVDRIDTILQEFRSRIRQSARTGAASGSLTPGRADELEDRLDGIARDFDRTAPTRAR